MCCSGADLAIEKREGNKMSGCICLPLADAYGLLRHMNGEWEWTLAPGVSPSPGKTEERSTYQMLNFRNLMKRRYPASEITFVMVRLNELYISSKLIYDKFGVVVRDKKGDLKSVVDFLRANGNFINRPVGMINGLYYKGGIYALPNDLSPGAKDIIPRMFVVDPMKRITLPEIYILLEVFKMGFQRDALIESIRKSVHNEGIVILDWEALDRSDYPHGSNYKCAIITQ
ncbi:Kinase associated domain 1 (KA1) [Artemisia annua]|uniref:Kinase associated domain 1 (KA1) n=1 Tax=Artemisia annua TaxID=35608 RepID=A0A2U1PYX5_ARTAN|nr:Kinase associated domain 1 (KA1) [Artemisia annua]